MLRRTLMTQPTRVYCLWLNTEVDRGFLSMVEHCAKNLFQYRVKLLVKSVFVVLILPFQC